MPKVGMEHVRRQQLIEATLTSIELNGLQGTTIQTISKIAGVSSGIISHYFGGKSGLLEACTIFLLSSLRKELLKRLNSEFTHPKARLYAIIDANFSDLQKSSKGAITWLAFWAQSMHSKELARLQNINAQRLISNLKYSLKPLVEESKVNGCAEMIAAQIDGVWLRAALSKEQQSYEFGIEACKQLIDQLVQNYGKNIKQ